MTIVQMLYFNTVCQYMNLTKAAEKLHISQPALSAVIKQIETECSAQLFKHRANSISITDEGLVLQQEVIPILEQYQHLERLLSSHKLDRNYLRVGLSPFRGNVAAPRIAALFRQRYPEVQLIITESGTSDLYEDLDLNRLDLIITSRKPGFSREDWQRSPLYGCVRLNDLQTVFAVSTENPLSRKESVTWAEIVQEPLMFLDKAVAQKDEIIRHIAEAGYQLPENVCYANQVHTIIRFVECSAAAAFLPLDAVKANPLLKGLAVPDLEPHAIYLVWRKDRHLYHTARKFVETAQEIYHQGEEEEDHEV